MQPVIRRLYCLLLQVRDDTSEDISENIARTVPICLENNGVILDMAASVQLVAFGAQDFGGPVEQRRDDSGKTSAQLLAALGTDVRIVSFSGDFGVGLVGTNRHISYTVLLPKYDRFLRALLDTEFGQMTDLGSV